MFNDTANMVDEIPFKGYFMVPIPEILLTHTKLNLPEITIWNVINV